MKTCLMLFAVLCVALLADAGAAAPSGTSDAPEPVRLIFDTDMDTDCDDAAALAMAHVLADRGEVALLGTMVSSNHRGSGMCTAAINTYLGRPDLPVGVPEGPGAVERGSRYAEQIAKEFPHDFPAGKSAPDATTLYRKILAGQPDGEVVIVTVGYLTNLRYLLESGPGDVSELPGRELVARKVKHWVCMGSRYPADLDPGVWGNFKPDPESTVKAIENWPTPIIFTGGGDFARMLKTGERLAETPAGNPVRRVYELYFDGGARNRHSADQVAVLVAARGTEHPWEHVTQGHNHIFPDGRHEWADRAKQPQSQLCLGAAGRRESR